MRQSTTAWVGALGGFRVALWVAVFGMIAALFACLW